MKETARLVVSLTVICVVAGLLLAWVNDLTAGPIASAAREEKLAAIRAVLPPFDNEPDTDTVTVTQNKQEWVFYLARKGGAFAGAAFETRSSEGYGGTIRLMVGVTADGKVKAIQILEHKETPGLGAKISTAEFRGQFANKDIKKTKWAVKKDGGDIDAITAATISSRAVTQAVKEGLDVYVKHEKEVGGGEEAGGEHPTPNVQRPTSK